jgi:hypothetical protein
MASKKASCLPPPVCARPTISSLCKMNRTFSLNNIFMQQQQQQIVLLPVDYDDQKHQQQRKPSDSSASTSSQGSTTPGPIQPTLARRRTPRNAQEFLEASGIDSHVFVNKGYYIGSMFNLNECTSTQSLPRQRLQQQTHVAKQVQTLNRKPKDVKRHSTFKRASSLKRDEQHGDELKPFGNTSALSMANLNLFNIDQAADINMFNNDYLTDQTSSYMLSNDDYEVLSQYSNSNGKHLKQHENRESTISCNSCSIGRSSGPSLVSSHTCYHRHAHKLHTSSTCTTISNCSFKNPNCNRLSLFYKNRCASKVQLQQQQHQQRQNPDLVDTKKTLLDLTNNKMPLSSSIWHMLVKLSSNQLPGLS